MIKKILSVIITVSSITVSMYANSSNKPSELINLPHPIKVIMPNIEKLKISKAQEKRLNKEMLSRFPELIQAKMKEISKLENKIKVEVLKKNKTKDQLSSMLDNLQQKKREVTDIHIEALNVLGDILTKKQMEQSLEMMDKPKKKNNKFKINNLVILPAPGKLIKTGKVNATMEQKQRISKEVKAVYAPVFQDHMREAFKLEKKVQRGIAKGKTKEDLKELLDEIAKLKRAATDGKIDALNQFKKIVTNDQWKKINKLSYQ